MSRLGVVYGIAAYGLWGLVPLYWALLDRPGEIEILAHRIVWSLLVVTALLGITRGFRRVWRLGGRSFLLLGAAAVVITFNWGTYIWGVVNGHVIETSLGYFINPLVTVLLGVVVLHERLRPVQWAALGLAAVAVVILTVDYGRPPWIALILAFSFGTYGLIKKKAGVGPVESLAVETAFLFLPALGFLVLLELSGSGAFGHFGVGTDLLLATAGQVTAIPLLFFGAAAIRVQLTTLGLLQYLAPVIQFALGVVVFREDVPPVRLVGFALVWTALAVLTAEVLVHRRRQLRAALAADHIAAGLAAGQRTA
ncbi:MAG TPA: EamA family transporter RarD [Jiangellaceae bacterium]|nr:EamA family transporter RarD [Jiangellaceae bacterium]